MGRRPPRGERSRALLEGHVPYRRTRTGPLHAPPVGSHNLSSYSLYAWYCMHGTACAAHLADCHQLAVRVPLHISAAAVLKDDTGAHVDLCLSGPGRRMVGWVGGAAAVQAVHRCCCSSSTAAGMAAAAVTAAQPPRFRRRGRHLLRGQPAHHWFFFDHHHRFDHRHNLLHNHRLWLLGRHWWFGGRRG